ncbi:hypothetical protein GY45DRAFT_460810 [Cubamyces sp. BRFM 1775]|nr:hypothetical protein GY45DRAFT_460810 [Cubamyces sp. BRFM 1775]
MLNQRWLSSSRSGLLGRHNASIVVHIRRQLEHILRLMQNDPSAAAAVARAREHSVGGAHERAGGVLRALRGYGRRASSMARMQSPHRPAGQQDVGSMDVHTRGCWLVGYVSVARKRESARISNVEMSREHLGRAGVVALVLLRLTKIRGLSEDPGSRICTCQSSRRRTSGLRHRCRLRRGVGWRPGLHIRCCRLGAACAIADFRLR